MAANEKKLDYGFVRMFDCYKGLLTDRQRDVMELYYNEDYSLSEIASVLDTEEKLGLAGRMDALRGVLSELRETAGDGDCAALAEKALGLLDGQDD